MLAFFQRQVESAESKKSLFIGIRQCSLDAFLFDFDTQNWQLRIDLPETRRALKRGPRVEAIAEVDEQGPREQVEAVRVRSEGS